MNESLKIDFTEKHLEAARDILNVLGKVYFNTSIPTKEDAEYVFHMFAGFEHQLKTFKPETVAWLSDLTETLVSYRNLEQNMKAKGV